MTVVEGSVNEETRVCSKCYRTLPITWYYHVGASSRNRKRSCRECDREKERKTKLKYPNRHPARNRVKDALKAGTLIRQPCEICGILPAQAHHDDYGKPLEVRWLCLPHHTEWHKHNKAKE